MGLRESRVFMSNLIRGSKYSLVSILSFGVEEGVLAGIIYSLGFSYIIIANIVAVFTSVAFGFFLNEHWTVRNEGEHGGGYRGLIIRMLIFQVIYALGSAVGILVQLFFYYTFGINPVIANIAGAIAAYPMNYVISLLYVWRIKVWKQ